MTVKTAAIIGAGVAGLTAALALARQGIASTILEQAPQLGEVGAGLQLSPNATRILGTLGVLPEIEKHWTEPASVTLASGRTLRELTAIPVGRLARSRWRAPYGVLHRSTLQQALIKAVLHEPLCSLKLGMRYNQPDRQAIPDLMGGRPDLVIGADGVWATSRDIIHGAPHVSFSGNIAWRFTVPAAHAPAFLSTDRVSAFLGGASHLVCYPVREIDGFNVVAIASGTRAEESWAIDADAARRAMLLEQFHGWHPDIRRTLAAAEHPTFWPLYEASDGRWQNGVNTVLIGDAAHAMMPFSAQGAAMAIEDAFVLATRLARQDLASALQTYESERKLRAARVKKRGQFNKFAYHARGPVRLGRDLVLSLRSPESLARDLDWLYGFQVT